MTSERPDNYPALPGIRQRQLHDIEGMSVRILEVGTRRRTAPSFCSARLS